MKSNKLFFLHNQDQYTVLFSTCDHVLQDRSGNFTTKITFQFPLKICEPVVTAGNQFQPCGSLPLINNIKKLYCRLIEFGFSVTFPLSRDGVNRKITQYHLLIKQGIAETVFQVCFHYFCDNRPHVLFLLHRVIPMMILSRRHFKREESSSTHLFIVYKMSVHRNRNTTSLAK